MKKAARVRAKDGGNSAERKKNRSFYSSLPLINWLRASEIDFKQSLDGEPVDFGATFCPLLEKQISKSSGRPILQTTRRDVRDTQAQ